MAKTVKVKIHPAAMRQLLTSPEVELDLLNRADNIALAAGPGMEVDSASGPSRARAMVWTGDIDAMLAEARDRVLTRAIDAGRHT